MLARPGRLGLKPRWTSANGAATITRTIIDAVLVGRIAVLTEQGDTSAIAKRPVHHPITIGPLGLAGDAQADLSVHGGVDKAIHHYPRDHYDWWRDTLGDQPKLEHAGAFGENISTTGLTEDSACLGDRYRMGSALVEITQGRQPCWKQAHHLGRPGVVAAMVATMRSGWYYRVIEAGNVGPGDALELLARPQPHWTVARVTGFVIGGRGKREPTAMLELARLAVLADGWRARAMRLAG